MIMEQILVTGGTGFIGSHLVRELLVQGHRVTVFLRDIHNLGGLADVVGCEFVEGDISIYDDVLSAFERVKPKYIYHCASLLSRGVQDLDDRDAYLVNELGSKNLIDVIVKNRDVHPITSCVIFGTSMEYGCVADVLSEDVECTPVGTYAVTKYNVTKYMQNMVGMYNVPIISLRVFTPYGNGMSANSLVARMCQQASKGEVITLSDPDVTRDFIYINDLIGLTLEMSRIAGTYRGLVFNAGTGVATTLKELVKVVLKESGSQSSIDWDVKRKSVVDAQVWRADMRKTYNVVSWRPSVSLSDGIKSMMCGVA